MAYYYFKSEDVKVFPCAWRGINAENQNIDPASRLNIEYNFINLHGTPAKDSYIVSEVAETNGTFHKLNVIIGGYYFEITDSEKKIPSESSYSLCIKVTGDKSEARPYLTGCGKSVNNYLDNNYLDFTDGSNTRFAGLCLVTAEEGKILKNTVDELQPSYYLEINPNANNAKFFAEASHIQSAVDGKSITKNFIDGNEPNSVALGNATANAENSVNIGVYNKGTTNSLFEIGNGSSSASPSNIVTVTKDDVTIDGKAVFNNNATVAGKAEIATAVIGSTDDDSVKTKVEIADNLTITKLNGTDTGVVIQSGDSQTDQNNIITLTPYQSTIKTQNVVTDIIKPRTSPTSLQIQGATFMSYASGEDIIHTQITGDVTFGDTTKNEAVAVDGIISGSGLTIKSNNPANAEKTILDGCYLQDDTSTTLEGRLQAIDSRLKTLGFNKPTLSGLTTSIKSADGTSYEHITPDFLASNNFPNIFSGGLALPNNFTEPTYNTLQKYGNYISGTSIITLTPAEKTVSLVNKTKYITTYLWSSFDIFYDLSGTSYGVVSKIDAYFNKQLASTSIMLGDSIITPDIEKNWVYGLNNLNKKFIVGTWQLYGKVESTFLEELISGVLCMNQSGDIYCYNLTKPTDEQSPNIKSYDSSTLLYNFLNKWTQDNSAYLCLNFGFVMNVAQN